MRSFIQLTLYAHWVFPGVYVRGAVAVSGVYIKEISAMNPLVVEAIDSSIRVSLKNSAIKKSGIHMWIFLRNGDMFLWIDIQLYVGGMINSIS